jgi:hypothetical protein
VAGFGLGAFGDVDRSCVKRPAVRREPYGGKGNGFGNFRFQI